jgi:CRISPR-associated protein Csm5
MFAEMVEPGTVIEGLWRENAFLAQPEIARMLHWREPVNGARLFAAANDYAERLLAIQKQYAAWTGLGALQHTLEVLEQWLAHVRETGAGCVLSLGWGGGLLGKTAWLETGDAAYRDVLKQIPLYARAVESGMPFPKTRRIVFLQNQPAALPGWVVLEVG